MGWATNFWTKTIIEDVAFTKKSDVLKFKKELEEKIEDIKNYLRSLVVMTDPRKTLNCGESDPIDVILEKYKQNITELERLVLLKNKVDLVYYNWEYCHNSDGSPIDYPDKDTEDNNYYDGEFIRSVNNPDRN